MAYDAVHRPDQIALKIGFYEKRCERIVDIFSGRVNRDTLHMRRFPQPGIDLTGEIRMDHNDYL